MSSVRASLTAALPLLLGLSCSARAQARFEPPFFFGLATAPGQSENDLPDIWMDWGRRGGIAAFRAQAQPERRLDFWTHPEVELDLAAGTGVQSQPGTAAQALPPGGRLVSGRTDGSSCTPALPAVFGACVPGTSAPAAPSQ